SLTRHLASVHRHAAHRALPSFPTRRSSDLAPAPGRPTARPLEAGAPTYPHPLTRPASPHDHPTRRGGPRARRPTARPLEADYPDRRTRPCLLTTTPPLATRTYVR